MSVISYQTLNNTESSNNIENLNKLHSIQQQNKGLKRNVIDKYYTKHNIVELCINNIKKNININNNDLIIEPSAGNGSFIKEIKSLSSNYLFLDLKPEHQDIIKQDFLEFNINKITNKYNKIHVIGNPPFGRQSSLAIKFIKKSCSFCDSISFILPKSFKKESLKKKIPLNFHLLNEFDLPNNSFLVNNIEYDVPCIFQIWNKKIYNRKKHKNIKPSGFLFVKKNENPDISFRRIGVNAGNIDVNIIDKSVQSHYFIKFINNISLIDNIKNISKIKYEFNNSVGPKSISKQELIKEFIKVL